MNNIILPSNKRQTGGSGALFVIRGRGAHRLGLVELEALEAAIRPRHGRPNPRRVLAQSRIRQSGRSQPRSRSSHRRPPEP